MKLREFTEPFFLARRALRLGVSRHADKLGGLLVDIGCGVKPYAELFEHCSHVGLEVTHSSPRGSARKPDVHFDGRTLPLKSGCADSVLCTQVLEHVFRPVEFVSEIHRILKPGGRLLLTVPFMWDEHEQPFDCARYTSFGLRHMLEGAGLRIVAQEKTLAGLPTLGQLGLCWLYKRVHSWPRTLRVATLAAFSLPINFMALLAECLPTANADLYLDNIVVCERHEA
jgi:SAM-dependent methyltransferase